MDLTPTWSIAIDELDLGTGRRPARRTRSPRRSSGELARLVADRRAPRIGVPGAAPSATATAPGSARGPTGTRCCSATAARPRRVPRRLGREAEAAAVAGARPQRRRGGPRPRAVHPRDAAARAAATRDRSRSCWTTCQGPSLADRWARPPPATRCRPPTRAAADLERRFGPVARRVRVHSGPGARSLLDHLGARGAASGAVILLRDPSRTHATVAHEVAHVVQTRPASAPRARRTVPLAADHPAEREAEALARGPDRVGSGPGSRPARWRCAGPRCSSATPTPTRPTSRWRPRRHPRGAPRAPPEGEPAPAAEEAPAPEEAPRPSCRPTPRRPAAAGGGRGRPGTGSRPAHRRPGRPTAADAAAPGRAGPDRQVELREVIKQVQGTWDDGAGGRAQRRPGRRLATAPGRSAVRAGSPPPASPTPPRLAEPAEPQLEEPHPTPLDEPGRPSGNARSRAPARAHRPARPRWTTTSAKEREQRNRLDLSTSGRDGTAEPRCRDPARHRWSAGRSTPTPSAPPGAEAFR